MSDVTYALVFSEMETAVQQSGVVAGKFTQILEQMNSTLQSQLSSWTGDAQANYATAYKTCHDAAAQMPVALTQAQSALQAMMDRYGDAERSVGGTFAG